MSASLMTKGSNRDAAADGDFWLEHNLAQLRYFRSLSLREKMSAVEGMADVVRRLEAIRKAETPGQRS